MFYTRNSKMFDNRIMYKRLQTDVFIIRIILGSEYL